MGEPFSSPQALDLLGAPLGAPFLLHNGRTHYITGSSNPVANSIAVSNRNSVADSFAPLSAVAIDFGSTDAGQHPIPSCPVVTNDELTMFFCLNELTVHIWQATRSVTTAPFSNTHLVVELSSPFDEVASWVSPDGCRLYFSGAYPADDAGNVQSDIFVASRAKN